MGELCLPSDVGDRDLKPMPPSPFVKMMSESGPCAVTMKPNP